MKPNSGKKKKPAPRRASVRHNSTANLFSGGLLEKAAAIAEESRKSSRGVSVPAKQKASPHRKQSMLQVGTNRPTLSLANAKPAIIEQDEEHIMSPNKGRSPVKIQLTHTGESLIDTREIQKESSKEEVKGGQLEIQLVASPTQKQYSIETPVSLTVEQSMAPGAPGGSAEKREESKVPFDGRTMSYMNIISETNQAEDTNQSVHLKQPGEITDRLGVSQIFGGQTMLDASSSVDPVSKGPSRLGVDSKLGGSISSSVMIIGNQTFTKKGDFKNVDGTLAQGDGKQSIEELMMVNAKQKEFKYKMEQKIINKMLRNKRRQVNSSSSVSDSEQKKKEKDSDAELPKASPRKRLSISQDVIAQVKKEVSGDIANMKGKFRELQLEFKDVNKANKVMKQEIKSYDNQFKELNKMYTEMEDRVLVAEKMLKFTKIQEERLNEVDREVKFRQMIDEQFFPTHKRVLELQNSMGELSKVYVEQQKQIDASNKEMIEALNLGKGTLKQQILDQVTKLIQILEKKTNQTFNETNANIKSVDVKIKGTKQVIEHWKDIQGKNHESIVALQEQLQVDKSELYMALDKQFLQTKELVAADRTKIDAFEDKFTRHQEQVKNRLQSLDGFEKQIKKNMASIEKGLYDIEKNRKLIEDFRNNEVFTKSEDNYRQLYQELMKQREILEEEFRPEVEKVKIDKTLFVKHQELRQVRNMIDNSNLTIKKAQVESMELREMIIENKEKIAEIETNMNKQQEKKEKTGKAPLRRMSIYKGQKMPKIDDKSNSKAAFKRSRTLKKQDSMKGSISLNQGETPATSHKPKESNTSVFNRNFNIQQKMSEIKLLESKTGDKSSQSRSKRTFAAGASQDTGIDEGLYSPLNVQENIDSDIIQVSKVKMKEDSVSINNSEEPSKLSKKSNRRESRIRPSQLENKLTNRLERRTTRASQLISEKSQAINIRISNQGESSSKVKEQKKVEFKEVLENKSSSFSSEEEFIDEGEDVHHCLFHPDMLRELQNQFEDFKVDIEDQFNDYMALDDADTFVETIVNDKSDILRAHLLKKAYEKYEKIDASIEEQRQDLTDLIMKKFDQLDLKYKEKTKSQDEIIDLISIEITKDSKKKSDIILELQEMKKSNEMRFSKLSTSVKDQKNQVEQLQGEIDVDFNRLLEKIEEIEQRLANIKVDSNDSKAETQQSKSRAVSMMKSNLLSPMSQGEQSDRFNIGQKLRSSFGQQLRATLDRRQEGGKSSSPLTDRKQSGPLTQLQPQAVGSTDKQGFGGQGMHKHKRIGSASIRLNPFSKREGAPKIYHSKKVRRSGHGIIRENNSENEQSQMSGDYTTHPVCQSTASQGLTSARQKGIVSLEQVDTDVPLIKNKKGSDTMIECDDKASQKENLDMDMQPISINIPLDEKRETKKQPVSARVGRERVTAVKKSIDMRAQAFKEFLPEVKPGAQNLQQQNSARVKSAVSKKVIDIEKKNFALSSAQILDNFGVTEQRNQSGERDVRESQGSVTVVSGLGTSSAGVELNVLSNLQKKIMMFRGFAEVDSNNTSPRDDTKLITDRAPDNKGLTQRQEIVQSGIDVPILNSVQSLVQLQKQSVVFNNTQPDGNLSHAHETGEGDGDVTEPINQLSEKDSTENNRHVIIKAKKIESQEILQKLKVELSKKIASYVPPFANPDVHKQLKSARVIDVEKLEKEKKEAKLKQNLHMFS